MKIIDKYILNHFIKNLLFGLLCFLFIFILVDLFENFDKFIDKNVSIDIIALYYVYFVPEILKLITPVGMLLASLFTISRFVNYSELTSMKSAGISLTRYLAPIMVVAFIITGFSVYFNGWIVPITNSKKLAIERNYLGRNQIFQNIQNIYIQDSKNRIIIINNYDKPLKICNNVSIQIFNKDTLNNMIYRFDANRMVYDTLRNDWQLYDLYVRKIGTDNAISLDFEKSKYISEIDQIKKINIDPSLIEKNQLKPEELILSDFKDFIDNLEKSGQETAKSKVDYYSIISFPFANIITVLFGVSVSSNRRKGGAGLQFGMSILVSFIYLGFVKISQVFGYNGDVNPILTAWLANIIFLAVSLANFVKLNKS